MQRQKRRSLVSTAPKGALVLGGRLDHAFERIVAAEEPFDRKFDDAGAQNRLSDPVRRLALAIYEKLDIAA
jgi:hypothetical protein